MSPRVLSRLLRAIFLLADERHYNLEVFYEAFLKSEEAFLLFRDYQDFYFSAENSFLSFLEGHDIPKGGEPSDETFLEYIAHLLTAFYETTKEEPSILLRYLPFSYLATNYEFFHTMDEQIVILEAKRDFALRNNAIRKARARDNVSFCAYNDAERLYYARMVYSKVFYYRGINQAPYHFDEIPFFASDETCFIAFPFSELSEERANQVDRLMFGKRYSILVLFLREDERADGFSAKIPPSIWKSGARIMLLDKEKLLSVQRGGCEAYYFTFTNADKKKCLKEAKMRFEEER